MNGKESQGALVGVLEHLPVTDIGPRGEVRPQRWPLGRQGQRRAESASGHSCQPRFPALQWQLVPEPPPTRPQLSFFQS